VLRELIERMPVELWLARLFGDSPVLMLSAREVGQQLTTRESFLGWLAFCDLALSMLELKTSVPILEEMHGARARDLARALDRAGARALARARDLARALDRALARALDRARALALDLARDRASNDTANTWGGGTSRLITAFLTGWESPESALHQTTDRDTDPEVLLVQHLERLVLGQGGANDWQGIAKAAELLADPLWSRTNHPFLRAGEMAKALRLLGLPVKGGTPLFEAKWFEPRHPLAAALNARPSEIAAAVDEFTKAE